MEKCTYCVQRISRARRDAKKENRAIRDGEVVTACQSACPTQAIPFGNLRRASAAVVAARQERRHFTLLGDSARGRARPISRGSQPQPGLEQET